MEDGEHLQQEGEVVGQMHRKVERFESQEGEYLLEVVVEHLLLEQILQVLQM